MHAVGRESLILRRERNGRKRIGVDDDDDGAALDSTRGKDDAHGWCPFSTARVERSCDALRGRQGVDLLFANSGKQQVESPVGHFFFSLNLSSLRAGLSVPDPDWKYERTQARKSDPSSHFSLCTLGTVR